MAAATGLAITIYLASAITAGVVGGAVAAKKKRHQGFWTVFAFLFPPLLLFLFLLPKGDYRPPRRESEWEDNLDRL